MPIKPYAPEVTYEDYCAALATLTQKDETAVFVTPELKTFLIELKHFMHMISMDSGMSLQDIVGALQNRDLFVLLQAAGWSLKKVSTKLKQILQVNKMRPV